MRVAVVIIVIIVAAAVAVRGFGRGLADAFARMGGPRASDSFYTLYTREEPTRSYVAYTGTPPVGPWGSAPWAEVAPSLSFARENRE